MDGNPHFESASSWQEAATLVEFEPLVPQWTSGKRVRSFEVHVMDHKKRMLAREDRSLGAYYEGFLMSQALKAGGEARRWALEVSYGPDPRSIEIGGHPARAYDLGPVPEPDDIDPRMPALICWYHDDMFYMVASDSLTPDTLIRVAESCYAA